MSKGGYLAPRHTEEELVWAHEKIIQMDNDVKAKKIKFLNLVEEYQKKFNRNLTVLGMYSWIRIIQDPSRRAKFRPKNGEEKKTFGAKFLLYVNHNICGFETIEEVKEFLKSNMILGGVQFYEKRSLNISYDIKLE